MAYKIGQYIGKKSDSYMENISQIAEYKEEGYSFTNNFSSHSFNNSGFYIAPSLERGEGYVLNVVIKQKTYIQDFYVKVKNTTTEMIIQTGRVSIGEGNENFKIIIIPELDDATDIIFELERTAADYEGSIGVNRHIEVVDFSFFKIINILDKLNDFNSRVNFIKGFTIEEVDDSNDLSFVMTGEEIKIGSDKYFELHEEMNLGISYLGFLIEPQANASSAPYFIFNYKYE